MRPSPAGIDPWLALALACAAGPPLALVPLVTAPAIVLLVAMLRTGWPRWWIGLVAMAALAAGARTTVLLRDGDAHHRRVVDQLTPPRRCLVEGDVLRSPVVVSASESERETDLGRARIDLRVTAGTCGDDAAPITVMRLYDGPEHARRGDRLTVLADVAAVQRFDNPGLLDPRVALARSQTMASGRMLDAEWLEHTSGTLSTIDRARQHVRDRLETTLPPDAVPLARALVLGETDLDESDREAFRGSGLAHLLAVSGTHLILVVGVFVRVLRGCLLRIGPLARRIDVGRVSAAFGIPAAWLYADFAGGGGSAWRASAMIACAFLSRSAGRRGHGIRSLAFALGAHALIDPLVVTDVSFALSIAATAALMAFARRSRDVGPPTGGLVARLRTTMLATAAASLGGAPLLLLLGSPLPVFGVAANVLAAPVGELIALPASLLHAGTSWAPPVEAWLARLACGSLRIVRAIATAAASAPCATLAIPPPTALELGALAVTLGARRRWPWRPWAVRICGALAVLGAEALAQVEGAPRGELRVTSLDVGQGDSLLVDLPDGRVMLVDGGGMVGSGIDLGKRVLLPELAARRRRRIDVVAITHPHPDHYLGLLSTLPEVDVGEIWVGGADDQGPPDLSEAIDGAVKRGARLRRPEELCQVPRRFGEAEVHVLSPCPGPDPRASTNDNSIVLRIHFRDRTALLVGDAEHATEAALLRRLGEDLRADLLKVGHHGSRTSTTEPLLRTVRPSVAVISCGVRNRFGHPALETLHSLSTHVPRTARTDREGAISWRTDGRRSALSTTSERRQAFPWDSEYDGIPPSGRNPPAEAPR